MPRVLVSGLMVLSTWALAGGALAQMMPGGMPGGPGGMPGGGPPGGGIGAGAPTGPGMGAPDDMPPSSSSQKPDVAARKAYKEAMKYLDKAKEHETAAAAASNADKKAKEMEKVEDAYSRALDAFTEALSNKGDMVEAWDNVGYVHLRLGAYRESIDDYDHALALKPEVMEAIEHRAEACLAVDRLDDVMSAYMDLYTHTPELAAKLMPLMQKWLSDHQANAAGMRPSDVVSFANWLSERDGVGKQAASLPQH